eukprot:6199503-Pleurochrysis_carterae.AAC.1
MPNTSPTLLEGLSYLGESCRDDSCGRSSVTQNHPLWPRPVLCLHTRWPRASAGTACSRAAMLLRALATLSSRLVAALRSAAARTCNAAQPPATAQAGRAQPASRRTLPDVVEARATSTHLGLAQQLLRPEAACCKDSQERAANPFEIIYGEA